MKPRKIPRGTFWIGGLAALALGLPLTTLTLVILAAHHHIGRHDVPEDQVALMAAIFAGLPGFITGGGVARLVAHRLVESAAPSTGRAVALGAAAMALGGIGMVVLTAVPLGGLPEQSVAWWPLGAAGAAVGAITGAAIGVLAGGRALRHRARAEAGT
jgi:hypothetical protein